MCVSMGSRVRKSKRPINDEELVSSIEKESLEEHLNEIQDNVSLKDVPLEESQKEAKKPLLLTRYE
jgi:hypothetical protein